MSDRTDQGLSNLTFELTQLAADHLLLASRLHDLNTDLVSANHLAVAKERVRRLLLLSKGLQKQAKQD